jgi:hypothetical protein
MKRLVLIGALLGSASGACGVSNDDRPRTLEYITQAVLAPTCAAAQCHSAFKREVGDQFDTVDATRQSIVNNGLVDILAPKSSLLYTSITVGAPSILSPGSGNVRMPFDAPMPDADVALILHWIEEGAPGAQCLPNAQGLGCNLIPTPGSSTPTYQVVQCVNGNAGTVMQTCPGKQVCVPFNGNGTCTGTP